MRRYPPLLQIPMWASGPALRDRPLLNSFLFEIEHVGLKPHFNRGLRLISCSSKSGSLRIGPFETNSIRTLSLTFDNG
jgi:hypothetical protein